MQGTTLLIAAPAVLLGGGIGYFKYAAAKKRRETFAAFAAQQGWSYLPFDNALAEQWAGTPFQTGDTWLVRNALSGLFNGRQMVAFDYSYQTHSSDSNGRRTTRTHKFGVVVLQLPGALPHLQVTHEGVFGGAVANAFGFRDIQFESDQFNREFRVKADDERFGRAVVTPRMMELLLARGEIGWRIEGNSLVGWDKGAHDPAQVISRLTLLEQVLEQVPPYVWRDYAGVDPRQAPQQQPYPPQPYPSQPYPSQAYPSQPPSGPGYP